MMLEGWSSRKFWVWARLELQPREKSSFEGFILDLMRVSLGVKTWVLWVGRGLGMFRFSWRGAYSFSLDFFLKDVCSARFAELNVF